MDRLVLSPSLFQEMEAALGAQRLLREFNSVAYSPIDRTAEILRQEEFAREQQRLLRAGRL